MGDPDPAKKNEVKHKEHRIAKSYHTFAAPGHFAAPKLTLPQVVQTRPPKPAPIAEPRLDAATEKALASAPSEVYVSGGVGGFYDVVDEIEKKLAGNASFVLKNFYAGGSQHYTSVVYWNQLDKPRAEALAGIVRSLGVPSVATELSGGGYRAPGHLTIILGTKDARVVNVLRDMEKAHFLLNYYRGELMAGSSGAAGEAVALDYLGVALRATDYTAPNEFRQKTDDERYEATLSAINSCISYIIDMSKFNDSLNSPSVGLRYVKYFVDIQRRHHSEPGH
jgi:hypothetical protein